MTDQDRRSLGLVRGALLAAVAALACAGCPPMLIATGASTAASAVADDRSLEQQGADLDLKVGVDRALIDDAPGVAAQVNVDVYLGRVMLTGMVPDWSARRAAVDAARGAAPGHEIYDDIQVSSGGSLPDAAADFAINKELGANLLAQEGLASQSFQHRVVNGTAYIMGQATQASQIELARQVALQTSGIQQVVTHIELR